MHGISGGGAQDIRRMHTEEQGNRADNQLVAVVYDDQRLLPDFEGRRRTRRSKLLALRARRTPRYEPYSLKRYASSSISPSKISVLIDCFRRNLANSLFCDEERCVRSVGGGDYRRTECYSLQLTGIESLNSQFERLTEYFRHLMTNEQLHSYEELRRVFLYLGYSQCCYERDLSVRKFIVEALFNRFHFKAACIELNELSMFCEDVRKGEDISWFEKNRGLSVVKKKVLKKPWIPFLSDLIEYEQARKSPGCVFGKNIDKQLHAIRKGLKVFFQQYEKMFSDERAVSSGQVDIEQLDILKRRLDDLMESPTNLPPAQHIHLVYLTEYVELLQDILRKPCCERLKEEHLVIVTTLAIFYCDNACYVELCRVYDIFSKLSGEFDQLLTDLNNLYLRKLKWETTFIRYVDGVSTSMREKGDHREMVKAMDTYVEVVGKTALTKFEKNILKRETIKCYQDMGEISTALSLLSSLGDHGNEIFKARILEKCKYYEESAFYAKTAHRVAKSEGQYLKSIQARVRRSERSGNIAVIFDCLHGLLGTSKMMEVFPSVAVHEEINRETINLHVVFECALALKKIKAFEEATDLLFWLLCQPGNELIQEIPLITAKTAIKCKRYNLALMQASIAYDKRQSSETALLCMEALCGCGQYLRAAEFALPEGIRINANILYQKNASYLGFFDAFEFGEGVGRIKNIEYVIGKLNAAIMQAEDGVHLFPNEWRLKKMLCYFIHNQLLCEIILNKDELKKESVEGRDELFVRYSSTCNDLLGRIKRILDEMNAEAASGASEKEGSEADKGGLLSTMAHIHQTMAGISKLCNRLDEYNQYSSQAAELFDRAEKLRASEIGRHRESAILKVLTKMLD